MDNWVDKLVNEWERMSEWMNEYNKESVHTMSTSAAAQGGGTHTRWEDNIDDIDDNDDNEGKRW